MVKIKNINNLFSSFCLLSIAYRLLTILFVFSFCFLTGCASITELGKKAWGSSMSHLEAVRPDGKSLEVAMPLDKCFEETEKILTSTGALVYLKEENKEYLAAMNFKGHVDTTEVGVFFSESGNNLVKVEVASMSPSLVGEVAELLSKGLRKI